ncbi:MAG: CidA/LrgA family protein [Butyrivibrio sp.]|nr:CidA/LrgA family protein [Butyrivibrio sp.]
MKYLKQLLIILTISFIGEILAYFIPFPIPASIYGIIILFVCLNLGIIKLSQVNETGKFLIEIMPIMFIPAAVGIIENWETMHDSILKYIILLIVSTIVVMVCSGIVTQFVIKLDKKGGNKNV